MYTFRYGHKERLLFYLVSPRFSFPVLLATDRGEAVLHIGT